MQDASDIDELRIWYALYRLEIRYWHDVDFNAGAMVHRLYSEDGLFAVGPNQFKGREDIKAFYDWRRTRGGTARHIVTNVLVTAENERGATASGSLTIYRSEGNAPPFHNGNVPALVADFTSQCVLGPDNIWRFASHVVRPIFRGADSPLSLSIDPSFLALLRQRDAARKGLPGGGGMPTPKSRV